MRNIAKFIDNADAGELRLLLAAVEKKLKQAQAGGEALDDGEEPPRCLDSAQLSALESSFKSWLLRARTPSQRRSRSRIWLAYLLLRYGALRLGELLALDDRKDIDAHACLVRTSGTMPRPVQMPKDLMRDIAALLDDPMFYSLRGTLLHIDPGYLRRKFYEQADLAGLPRDLVNPRVLRYSRAVELVGGGVPVKAVQLFLGQGGRPQPGAIAELSPDTGQRIVQQYLNKEVKMKTSARNLFIGRVSRLVRDGLLAEVELTTLSGLCVVAVITEESLENLRIAEGSVVTASVKAPWVVLARPDAGQPLKSSARNQFAGKVALVKEGSLASELLVDLYEGSKLCALVTGDSVKRLGLGEGVDVVVMFKAFSVILNAD